MRRDILRFRRAPQRYPYRSCGTQTLLGQQALALSPWSELDTENPGPHSGHRDPWDPVPRPASHTQPARLPHRSPPGWSFPTLSKISCYPLGLPPSLESPPGLCSVLPPPPGLRFLLPRPTRSSLPTPWIPRSPVDLISLPPCFRLPPAVPVSWFRCGHPLSPKPRPHPCAPGH